MIPFDEALRRILQHAAVLGRERVPLGAARGRVLAEALRSPGGWPLFDNSAVDGYGVRAGDVGGADADRPARLRCTQTVRAGEDASGVSIAAGEAVRIFTGAMIPAGVQAVVMREDAIDGGDTVELRRSAAAGANIRRRHTECRPGDELLAPGAPITPQVVGLLAACGQMDVAVYRRPRVVLVGTGDELIQPGRPLRPGQIHDSNSPALAAALAGLGLEAVETRHAVDEAAALRADLAAALDTADVLITVGGVSVGDYDLVRDVLQDLGVQEVFWGVAMKPGKPNFFGLRPTAAGRSARLVFGLPGNPVSAMVSLRQLVFPALRRMLGFDEVLAPRRAAVLTDPVVRRPGRLEFARGTALHKDGDLQVTVLAGQDSHMLVALARANCLVILPAERERFDAGERVMIEDL